MFQNQNLRRQWLTSVWTYLENRVTYLNVIAFVRKDRGVHTIYGYIMVMSRRMHAAKNPWEVRPARLVVVVQKGWAKSYSSPWRSIHVERSATWSLMSQRFLPHHVVPLPRKHVQTAVYATRGGFFSAREWCWFDRRNPSSLFCRTDYTVWRHISVRAANHLRLATGDFEGVSSMKAKTRLVRGGRTVWLIYTRMPITMRTWAPTVSHPACGSEE